MEWREFIPTVIAALVTTGATAALVRLADKYGWVTQPNSERWNKRSVAKFGGIAILLGLIAALAGRPLTLQQWTVFALSLLMGLMGFFDDLWNLRARHKLLIQIAVAFIAVSVGIVYPTGLGTFADYALTILWLVGITNAFNLLDNMDGLSAGIGCIVAVNLFLLMHHSNPSLESMMLAMAGALAGFLFFNFNPARIFMGDTGSLAIGFFFACSTILGAGRITSLFSVVAVPSLVLFIPIFDVALVSVTRRFNGRAISAGARDHSSHRLVMLGMSERAAVLTLYVIAAMGGAVAYAWKYRLVDYGPGLLAIFLLGAVLFWLYLARIEMPEDWLSRTNVFTLAFPTLVNSLATHAGAMLMDSALLALSLYISFLARFDQLQQHKDSFVLALALAIPVKILLLSLYGTYKRAWRIASVRDVYPIFKAAGAGSLVLITALTFLNRFQDFSRAVFVTDFVFNILLLCVARHSSRLFDSLFTSKKARTYVVVGEKGADFALHYLQWTQPKDFALAVCANGGSAQIENTEVPVHAMRDLPSLINGSRVDAVYLAPECDLQEVFAAVETCTNRGIPVYKLAFSMNKLAVQPVNPSL